MLTRKQMDLLIFINKRLARDGVPPSFDEMKDHLNLRSKSGIHRLITALEERGFIRRLAHKARAIEILRMPDVDDGKGFTPRVIEGGAPAAAQSDDFITLDKLGRIAAGVPIEAIEHDSHITLPASMLRSAGRHYALEVRGDSMIDAGILDGDIVIVRETSSAHAGDIVVAQVDGYEATLKTYRPKGDMICLEAANPVYEPRILPKGSVAVQGVLAGLIRSY